jgi:pyruvate dehydrogenase E1 component alpha subunit
VVQNNQWAISVPLAKQTRAHTLAHKAVAHGIPSARVDGNDVLAVNAVARWAVERARAGKGPTLIEALTYRVEPHTTSDDPRRYRTAEEEASWQTRDPIARFEQHLREGGAIDDELRNKIEQEASIFAMDVRERLIGQPDPHPLEMFDYVHATGAQLELQRASLEQELKRLS